MELSDEEIINRLKLKSRKLSTNYLINKKYNNIFIATIIKWIFKWR